MGTFIVIVLIVAIVGGLLLNNSQTSQLKKEGFDPANTVPAGQLVGGHPDIDNEIKNTNLVANDEAIAICDLFSKKGAIDKNQIKDVKFEDATTFGKRVSIGRVLLVGIFALAWRKKSKNENSYVVVEWNDGRFDHSTSFLFEGKGSATKANTCRNWLIKNIR